jgi:hypothetical protein
MRAGLEYKANMKRIFLKQLGGALVLLASLGLGTAAHGED